MEGYLLKVFVRTALVAALVTNREVTLTQKTYPMRSRKATFSGVAD